MEVKLKKIILKNYMGAKDVIVDFSEKTEIRGRNACGKSTLMNAYFDVMTGKFANGTAPNNICPIDKDGNEFPVKEILRSVVLEIDGEEHEISKITKRKYRKEVFIGNETVYKLDGSPAKASEVADFISEIAPAETIATCSNASVFLSAVKKSTAEARKKIESLSGFDLTEFCEKNEEWKKAYGMAEGKPIEDMIKVLKSACKAANSDLDKLNIELDYERRCLNNLDKSNLEKFEFEKSEITKKITDTEELRKSLDGSIDHYTYLLGQADAIRKQMREIEDNHTKEQRIELEGILIDKRIADREISNANIKIEECDYKILHFDKEISKKEEDLKNMKSNFDSVFNAEFNGNNCPTCGQKFPEKDIEAGKQKFDENKEKMLSEMKDEMLCISENIKSLNKQKLDCIENRSDYTVRLEKWETIRKTLKEKEDGIKISTDFSGIPEYMESKKKLSKTEKEAGEISDAADLRKQVSENLDKLKADLSNLDGEIRSIITATETSENRIVALEDQTKAQAQAVADIERDLYLLQQFSIAKNAALEEMVNDKFDFIKIRMSEETLDGTLKETLRITVNGIDYFNGLNHGDRILAEIYLLKGLQDMNGLKLPIWSDDTESLDDCRIPDVSRQMILIRRTDDEKLNVCKMEG